MNLSKACRHALKTIYSARPSPIASCTVSGEKSSTRLAHMVTCMEGLYSLSIIYLSIHLQFSFSFSFSNHSSNNHKRSTLEVARRMMVIESLEQAIQMRRSSHDDQNMKYLMGTPPYVKRAGRRSFGPTSLHHQLSLSTLVYSKTHCV